eukprot:c11443_g1_i2.p1 GENE.c11443_g1_i2~~c11443_g1_i2.p1  ORF type:complete len:193 (+),score=35.82 c11443_g1_i2:134-712(+)
MREINSDILEKRKYLIKVLQQFASVLHLSTSEVSKLQNREDLVTSEIANISRLRRELQSSSRALRNQPGIGVGLSSSESESGASGQDDEELSSDSEDDDEDQQEPQVNVTTESPKSRSSRLSRVLSGPNSPKPNLKCCFDKFPTESKCSSPEQMTELCIPKRFSDVAWIIEWCLIFSDENCASVSGLCTVRQ